MSTETLAKALRDFAEIDFDNVFVPAARLLESQAAEIEALRNERIALVKMLTTASAHLHWARRNSKCDTEEMTFAQVLKEIDGAIDAAMQTKEAS